MIGKTLCLTSKSSLLHFCSFIFCCETISNTILCYTIEAQNCGMMGPFIPRERMRFKSYDLCSIATGQCPSRSALSEMLWMQLSHMDAEKRVWSTTTKNFTNDMHYAVITTMSKTPIRHAFLHCLSDGLRLRPTDSPSMPLDGMPSEWKHTVTVLRARLSMFCRQSQGIHTSSHCLIRNLS